MEIIKNLPLRWSFRKSDDNKKIDVKLGYKCVGGITFHFTYTFPGQMLQKSVRWYFNKEDNAFAEVPCHNSTYLAFTSHNARDYLFHVVDSHNMIHLIPILHVSIFNPCP